MLYIHRIKSLLAFALLASCAAALPAHAQDKDVAAPQSSGTAQAQAPTGLLPIPDYSADFWDNAYLTGDWFGVRTELADKGVQVGAEWTQFYQGVVNGGHDITSQYGANANYTINLDLMRMGVLPGALIKFRAESRYGSSVNGDSGLILPVNTQAFFPLTSKLNQKVGITITDLNYTQFLSPHFAVTLGKLDTLDGDANEFASGRGTSEFMNGNFVFNSVLALRLPYSTLGAGVIWMPIPTANDRGITVTSIFMNTQDSSTTSGFDDFDKGTTWNTEADFRYKLGNLPGGMNLGALYSFNQHFAELNSRFIFQPGQGLRPQTKSSTWAVYWSDWQYLYCKDPGAKPLPQIPGSPTREGIGLFARAGFADKETNPVEWSASGGIGGRGMIPTRENDTFGVGYYYNNIERLRFSGVLGIRDSSQGFECFYNIAVTPACRVTLDAQLVESAQTGIETSTVLGLRASMDF